jgi:hypothetical protein
MALGKIKADTLEHSTAGSLDTQYVVNGSAKAWVNYTGVSSTSARDSLNISSLTDAATGKTYPISFVSNMANDDYSGSYYQNSATDVGYTNFSNSYVGGFGSFTTASFGNNAYGSSGQTDSGNNYTTIFGDLA